MGIDDVRTAVEFAAVLSDLRRASGKSLRSLSQAITATGDDGEAAHASFSTLGEWCRGDRLPQLTHLVAFERLLTELGVSDTDRWLEVLAQVREHSIRNRETDSPYKGLDSFTGADRTWFFGRSQFSEEVVSRIRTVAGSPGPKLLWILGMSGAGKSSLMHAGVLPQLQDDGWECESMTPGQFPLQRLEAVTADGNPNPDAGRILFVDAFEEVFTEADDDDRHKFATQLARLAQDRVVVCAARAGFFAQVADLPLLGPTLTDSQMLLRPMSEAEVREAIIEPARLAGGSIDDDLVEVLVRELIPSDSPDSHLTPGTLPLMSFALAETWSLRRRGRMTLSDFFAIGGLGGAVSDAAEEAYESLAAEHRHLAERVFVRLVHLSPNAVTRHHASRDELAGLDSEYSTADDIIGLMKPFIEARLITVGHETVRLTHEVVLTAWPRLREWLDTHRAALAQHHTIALATRQWLELDRDDSALATGNRLMAMSLVADAGSEIGLSRDERAFLEASQATTVAREETRRRRARALRASTGVAACLAVVAAALAFLAERSRSDAVAAREDALSRQIAITAEGLVTRDLSMAQQLAVAAYDVAPTAEATAALLDLGAMPHPSRYLGGAGSTAVAIAPSGEWFALTNNLDATVQLFEQSDNGYRRAGVLDVGEPGIEVYALGVGGPAEDLLAVGDTTATITLWDVGDLDAPTELVDFEGPSGPVQGIAIKPDGSTLAAVGATPMWQTDYGDDPEPVDAVLRWDISDPAEPEPLDALPIATEVTWSLAYNEDGSLLAVGDEEGRMSLWATDPEPRLLSHVSVGERSTVAVAVSGTHVATGTRTSDLAVWDISDPADPAEVEIAAPDFSTWINTVRFSPDGTRFVAGGSDSTLQVWETASWRQVTALPHPDPITQTSFADDGTLLTGAVDGTARMWDVHHDLPERMIGIVGDTSFTADGSRAVAISGWDAAVWDTTDEGVLDRVFHELGDDLVIGSGSISPDGSMLAYGTIDGIVRLYDLDSASPTPADLPLGGASGVVQSANFSADSQVLAAGTGDGLVRLWDVSDIDAPELVATVHDASQIVLQVSWSPASPMLAVASAEGAVFVYNVEDPSDPVLVSTVDVLASEAYTAAFSPDGATLAIAGTESDVWILDLSDPADPRPMGDPLSDPSSRVYDLAFDSDGDRLAAAITDGTVWLWDTSDPSSPDHIATFGPRDEAVFTVAFHPTQNRLLASGIDPTIVYWDLDVDRVIAEICLNAGDIITEDEWARHLPSEPYDPPCKG